MLKRLLLVLFISSPLLAQYSSADFELVRTTFERKFERKIIDSYLSSKITANVKAALLSLSNAQDTSLVEDIIKPDYSLYGNYIAFALGESGPCTRSEEYLLDKIFSKSSAGFQRANFEALGRCGSKQSLSLIVDKYNSNISTDYSGISLAIVNFAQRGIRIDDSSEMGIILKELTTSSFPIKRRIEAAFAGSRIGLPVKSKNDLLRVLFEKNQDEDGIILSQYVLACLRKLKASPDSPEQLKALVNQPDWRLRVEASKVMANHQFKSIDDINIYLRLLTDSNPNVSRQAAISLNEIKIDSALTFYLKDELKKKLSDVSLTKNTAGEIYASYCKFFPGEIFSMADQLKDRINQSFVYRALSENLSAPQNNLTYLLKGTSSPNKSDKLELLNAMLPLQKSVKKNTQLDSYLITNLSSNFPAAISTVADGLDSVFIDNYKEELKKIITRQIHLNKNNADFSESNLSLVNLAEKISPELKKDMLNVLLGSELYSMQNYACKELGRRCGVSKNPYNFFELWTNAFKYAAAKVTTDKGIFVIKFSPEFAPVSVGNFCKLAQTGFFTNIIFHRVVPDFVIQTGDPQGTGWGGPGYDIISEFSPIPFERSYVGMASSGKDTEGSQWFVMHSNFPHLNGRYSNFGKVVEGMDIVSVIDQNDKVLNVELLK